MLKALGSKIRLTESNPVADEYMSYVSDLIDHDVVCEMKQYTHHGRTTCFQHCLNVSYYNFVLCKLLSLDARAAARGGLLHDLFLYDWHTHRPRKGRMLHGYTHPADALENAKKHFELTAMEQDIIEKHMFPLTLRPPKYRETVVITLVDKYCGLIEVLSGWVYSAKDIAHSVSDTLRRHTA